MQRWVNLALIASAAGVAAAQWLLPTSLQGLLGGLLLGLVILAIFSQHNALQATLDAVHAAHLEQLEIERRYRAIFDACSDPILVYELREDGRPGEVKEANEAACRSLGYQRPQLLSMAAEDIYVPEELTRVRAQSRALQDAGAAAFETVQRTSHGRRLPVEVSARTVRIGGRRLCLAVSHSIAAQKEREGALRSLTDFDELTGLLNRRGFFAGVSDARSLARRTGASALLMYFDVDGLKQVNDRLGHPTGDALLMAAADVLRRTFRERDVVARLGGDEFVALALLDRSDERLTAQAIEMRLERALQDKRVELGGAFDLSLSHGALVAPHEDLARIDELLARADQLMYAAKQARRSKPCTVDERSASGPPSRGAGEALRSDERKVS